jgi:hypothetical protein
MTSVIQTESIEMAINNLLALSNSIIDSNIFVNQKVVQATLVNTDSKVLTICEKELLSFQIKDFAVQFVTILRNLSININYKWIEELTPNNCVNYFYKLLIDSTDMAVTVINDMLSIDTIRYSYNKTLLMNAVIIYGGAVYFLNKFIQIPLLKKTQSEERMNTIYNKLEVEHKVNFYNAFNRLIDDVLTYFEYNENYNINLKQLADDRIVLLSLLIDCCQDIESLNFNTFLA